MADNKVEYSAEEIAILGYRLILPKLKKLLIYEKDISEAVIGRKSNIQIVKVRLKKILNNPRYFKIKKILMNSPFWDPELNILSHRLQNNV